MTQKFDPGPWEVYAGEAAHYSYVRCLELGRIYETVRATHEKDGGQAEFLHQVFFMAEYSEPELVEILRGFGYESLDAYVSELNQSGFVIGPDGKIDRRKSPAWYIDYMYLASLMAEHFEGRRIPVQEADRLARSIVGECPDTAEQTAPMPKMRQPSDCSAAYAVNVLRRRSCGLDTELYCSCFYIAQDRLPASNEDACAAFLRHIIRDFLKTEEGRCAYEKTFEDFNWGDAATYIPDGFWARYGVSVYSSSQKQTFSCCGIISILVGQDELLGEELPDGGDEQ